ncbi:MAG: DUF4282 domain-containing protein [Candidatus Sumerlaeaceae bacterium]|nr:DUF4282 domain-containing protein [Candidatus Sumerlaeaceae bacterium]
MDTPKGFVEALFDLSFSEFITTRLVKILYILGMFLAGVGALLTILGGIRAGAAAGLLALGLAVLMFFVIVIALRVWLELVIVIFRIAETLREIAKK